MRESYQVCEWAMSHRTDEIGLLSPRIKRVTWCVVESCHVREWILSHWNDEIGSLSTMIQRVKSYVWCSHVMYVNESRHAQLILQRYGVGRVQRDSISLRTSVAGQRNRDERHSRRRYATRPACQVEFLKSQASQSFYIVNLGVCWLLRISTSLLRHLELAVTIKFVNRLPQEDAFGKCDPFITLSFFEQNYATEVHKKVDFWKVSFFMNSFFSLILFL